MNWTFGAKKKKAKVSKFPLDYASPSVVSVIEESVKKNHTIPNPNPAPMDTVPSPHGYCP